MMRVLAPSLTSIIYLSLIVTSSAHAQEASGEPTTAKVYRVSDLVAREAMRERSEVTTITPAEWKGEHQQTIESLHHLAKLIETILPDERRAVTVHEDSLSLVVLHSAAGHRQIAELLEQLRKAERPVVELTLIPLEGFDVTKSPKALGARLEFAVIEPVLDPESTDQLLEYVKSNQKQKTAFLKPVKVSLVNGRKTLLLRSGLPRCVTILATDDTQEIRLRVDSTQANALEQESFQAQTQSFAVPPGHSFVLLGGYETCWLAIPRRIEPEPRVTSVSRDTTE